MKRAYVSVSDLSLKYSYKLKLGCTENEFWSVILCHSLSRFPNYSDKLARFYCNTKSVARKFSRMWFFCSETFD